MNAQSISEQLNLMAKNAKKASWRLAQATTEQKNALLISLAENLAKHQTEILAANALDMQAAQQNNLPVAMQDRLLLNPERLAQIISEVKHVAQLDDPVGKVLDGRKLSSGLSLERRTVPLGVVAVIYEARPNVTVDVASLCLKTGNAVILRGGKETQHTNKALVNVIQNTLRDAGFPEAAAQAITDPDREWVNQLLKLDHYIDMLIPRGGASLHQLCKNHSTIPVITGGIGVCHLYLSRHYPDFERALELIDNAKTHRPSACNSLETLLIDQSVAAMFLPLLIAYMQKREVTLRACEKTLVLLGKLQISTQNHLLEPVELEHYREETLAFILNVKIVDEIDEAIEHIREYGTAHSDAILTENINEADYFVNAVDSAAVYVNASTRFTDGAQFGLGAEVAVSTQKLHARGPLGLEALTTYKWIGRGDSIIRA